MRADRMRHAGANPRPPEGAPPAASRPDRPKVVLDTNVIVAAGFEPAGHAARLLERVRRGELRAVWNDATRHGTERIVRTIPPLAAAAAALDELYRPEDRCDAPADPAAFRFVPDPEDRKYLALATAAGATLVTLDEHLLGARDRASVPVLRPDEYLRTLDRAE